MLWQSPGPPPIYRSKAIQEVYAGEELRGYRLFRSPAGLFVKAFWYWGFYLGPLLTLPLLMLAVVLPYGLSWAHINRGTRFLLPACGTSLLGLALETFCHPHYAAPLTGLILALVIMAMRRLQSWRWRGKRTGLFMSRSIPLIGIIMFLVRASAGPLHLSLAQFSAPAWYQLAPHSFGRAAALERLQRLEEGQLVIVRYKPTHFPFEEWVYNEADIDAAKVVWAREMDAAQNEKLIRYFGHRRAWLLEADEKPPRLSPYPGTAYSAREAGETGSWK